MDLLTTPNVDHFGCKSGNNLISGHFGGSFVVFCVEWYQLSCCNDERAGPVYQLFVNAEEMWSKRSGMPWATNVK
eukprot:Awhi_evm1s13079